MDCGETTRSWAASDVSFWAAAGAGLQGGMQPGAEVFEAVTMAVEAGVAGWARSRRLAVRVSDS